MSLARPLIMGIVNITPDSFADGGRYLDPARAEAHARRLIDEGADIIDIGAESSRPGATSVSTNEELRRVLPVLERLDGIETPISIDTTKPDVMRQGIAAGASIINDINALQEEGALEAIRHTDASVCLMHKQGTPHTMQENPHYGDVVAEVAAFLADRARFVLEAGVAKSRLMIDPGFGFGKRISDNAELFRELGRLRMLDLPILVGLSRKSMLGAWAQAEVSDRLSASIAAAVIAVAKGANIVRVHDVKATRQALAIMNEVGI